MDDSRRGSPRGLMATQLSRRITAATCAGSCTVLKVMAAETYVEGRGLERTVQSTIDQCTGGARRIDRRSYVKRHVRGVDAHVLIVLIHP
jgi:hypothetical protein